MKTKIKNKKTGRATVSAAEKKAKYETERWFAAEQIVRNLLEDGTTFTFESPEDEEELGTAELYGVEDARDEDGCGGAWAVVRFYIPNLDIDTEIES